MGWKNIRDHYRIQHTVQVTEAGICIGTGYVHDLIVIKRWEKKVNQSSIGIRGNESLQRYWAEMHADLDKLWELVEKDDQFEKAIPVYTWKEGDIIEERCEELGWPNVTHDGKIMYENKFSADRNEVIRWAIQSFETIVRHGYQRISEIEDTLRKIRQRHGEDQADLAKLRHEALTSGDRTASPNESPLVNQNEQ